MTIPDYQTFMRPLLEFIMDGKEHAMQEAYQALADRFDLTEDERNQLLPSGQQEVYKNRIGWARTYLKKAGFLSSPRRGYVQIMDLGKQKVLADTPINTKLLKEYPDFQKFQNQNQVAVSAESDHAETEETPEEALEKAYQVLRDDLASDLLENLKKVTPSQFEKIVVELLVKMGYGGSLKDAGMAIGKSGDQGIDGIIKEDKLGLDVIYVQAKRWEGNVVGRPEVQKFAGALQGKNASKGIFITTSTFSSEAETYANNLSTKIVLIDGDYLAKLMTDHNLGVSPVSSYEVKKIDTDLFVEE